MGWMNVRVNAEMQLEAQDDLRQARSHSRPRSKALASDHVNTYQCIIQQSISRHFEILDRPGIFFASLRDFCSSLFKIFQTITLWYVSM